MYEAYSILCLDTLKIMLGKVRTRHQNRDLFFNKSCKKLKGVFGTVQKNTVCPNALAAFAR